MSRNTSQGTGALASVTTGNDDTAFGYNAGNAITTGTGNTIMGSEAGEMITIRNYNSLYGHQAGRKIGTVEPNGINQNTGNSVFGAGAMSRTQGSTSFSTNSLNCVMGHNAAYNETSTYSQCVAIGTFALNGVCAKGYYFGEVAIGQGAGGMLEGDYNMFMGYFAGRNGTPLTSSVTNQGEYNIGIGPFCFYNTYDTNNVVDNTKKLSKSIAIGPYAFSSESQVSFPRQFWGENNVAIGYQAGKNMGTATGVQQSDNIYIVNYGNSTDNNTIRLGNTTNHQRTYLIPKLFIDNENLSDDRYVLITAGNNGSPLGTTTSGDITLQALTGTNKGKMLISFNGAFSGSSPQLFNGNKTMWSFEIDQTGNKDDFRLINTFNSPVAYFQAGNLSSTIAVGARSNPSFVGAENSSFGTLSLGLATTSDQNAAFGYGSSGLNTTGSGNSSFGYLSLNNNSTGSVNTAIGYKTLMSILGTNNTAIGSRSGENVVNGNNNIYVGANIFPGATNSSNIYIGNTGVNNESNTIRIGSSSGWLTTHSRAFISGIRGVTTAVNDGVPVLISSQGQLGTASSSITVKDKITVIDDDDMEKFDRLEAVSFTYKCDAKQVRQYGLIAEQVAEVMPELVAYNGHEPETVKYHLLHGLAIKKIQQQNKQIAELKLKNADLEARLSKIEKFFNLDK